MLMRLVVVSSLNLTHYIWRWLGPFSVQCSTVKQDNFAYRNIKLWWCRNANFCWTMSGGSLENLKTYLEKNEISVFVEALVSCFEGGGGVFISNPVHSLRTSYFT